MASETREDQNLGSRSPIDNLGYASYGVFSGSPNFTVAGGTFINTTNTTKNYHTAPTVPSDFPRIPMEDVDLQDEIRMDNWSGVVDIQPKRRSVRRVYSAKIDRGKSSVTVATYQGESAEEEWRIDVTKYMAVRHPNIVQLRVTASYGNIYATIFHDDLIPFREFEKQHRHSHLSNVYIAACVDTEFRAVQDYFDSTFQRLLIDNHCTCFIRHSTGRLCVDLEPGHDYFSRYFDLGQFFAQQNIKTLKVPSLEAAALDLLKSCVELFDIVFNLSISKTTADLPEGFLFLCPPTDFQTDPLVFKWPECSAYWCLDPFGAKPLSWKDAANLGFPSLKLRTYVSGCSWDASVYAGVRQFHQAKGFDPDSQDVARYLGLPLLQCESPSETNIPFAHIDDYYLDGASEEDDSSASITELENTVAPTDAEEAVSNASPAQSSGSSGPAPEMPVVGALEFMLGVQLALIMFLPLSALYARRA